MKAAVMSIGSELLGGFLTDTNATFLAQDMATVGIELVGVMQVGDDMQHIVRALRRAAEDADITVISGGVGPTEDDLTREAIAEFAGEEVYVDPDQLKAVEKFFAARGITNMPERNRKQAWLIHSAEALPNPVGTAPGWFVHHHGHIIVSMPGVPREMKRMWQDQVLPRLGDQLGTTAIVSTTVKTIGIGESTVEDMISDIIHEGNPVVATYAKDDGVHVRITAAEADRSTAEQLVSHTEARIREIFGAHAYGDLNTRLGQAILRDCQRLSLPLRIIEAGSAGRITNLLAEETELSEWFIGGSVQSAEVAMAGRDVSSARELAGQLLRERAEESSVPSATMVIAATFSEPVDGERYSGDIAFLLDLKGEILERTHTVQASPSEIRRRAALWASEFLHVSLATHASESSV